MRAPSLQAPLGVASLDMAAAALLGYRFMPLTGVFHFKTQQLWVMKDLQGRSLTIRRGEHLCHLDFPAAADSFADVLPDDPHRAISSYVSKVGDDPEEKPFAVAVDILRVRVTGPGDLHLAAFSRDQESRDASVTASDDGFRKLIEFQSVAVRCAESFITWVRSAGPQPWLGLAGEPPTPVGYPLLYDDNGDRLPVGVVHPATHLHIGTHDYAVRLEHAQSLARNVEAGTRPPLSSLFLDDAYYIAFTSPWRNLRQAVLLAAIACEIAIKARLADGASAEQAALVELVLENPRDVSMAAVSLFDKGANAVFQRSLRTEEKVLYKAVDTLFQHRNKIAHHGGESLTDEELSADVQTARAAGAWVNTL